MAESRKRNSIKNISTGLVAKVITIIVSFASRTVFIKFLGEACLGLNGLFTTILSLLSLAELGIADAIAFYLYSPILHKNDEKIRQLVSFYKICYRIIGVVFLALGLLLLPALPHLVNLETDTGYNLYLIYILYLLNSSFSYLFFSYPQTVLAANQKAYITTTIGVVFQAIMLVCDVVSMVLTRNYIVYLLVRILLMIIQNVIVFFVAKARYPYIAQKPRETISKTEVKKLLKDVYGVFVLKISGKLVDSTDNLFISFFLGTILVGYNSNYLTLIAAASSIIVTVIYAFSGSVGNFVAEKNKNDQKLLFYKIDTLDFVITFCCAIFLFSFSSHFIALLWGEKMVLDTLTVALMCFNFYIVNSLHVVFLFRNCLGLFRSYMYMQLISAIANIILDFLLVNVMGIMGLCLATVLSTLLFAVFPYVISLFKDGFSSKPNKYILSVVGRYFWTILIGFVCFLFCKNLTYTFNDFLFRIFLTTLIVFVGVSLYVLFDKNARAFFKLIMKKAFLRKQKNS